MLDHEKDKARQKELSVDILTLTYRTRYEYMNHWHAIQTTFAGNAAKKFDEPGWVRGGKAPNYDAASLASVCESIVGARLRPQVMIDISHGNSSKRPENQPAVAGDIAQQIEAGERRIAGVMVESHLVAGRQDLTPGRPLVYGQSITDGCIDWATSVGVLERLAEAVEKRRS